MKKILSLVIILTLSAGIVNAESLRAIPYPESLDTKSEGASSVLGELNHVPSRYFDTDNDFFTMKSTDTRIILPNYPTYQQTREETCGPASALTVLYYFGVKDYDELKLAEEMKTRGYPIGTNPKDMLAFFERIGWKNESSLTHEKFKDEQAMIDYVKGKLSAGIPILVENIDWGGHWRVIIGYDSIGTGNNMDDVFILMDPYDTCDHKQDGYVVENAVKFYSMWFDHSMFAEDMKVQPFIATWPEKK